MATSSKVAVTVAALLVTLAASACKTSGDNGSASVTKDWLEIGEMSHIATGESQLWRVELRAGHQYGISFDQSQCFLEDCVQPALVTPDLLGRFGAAPTTTRYDHRDSGRLTVVGNGQPYFVSVRALSGDNTYSLALHDMSCSTDEECPNAKPVRVSGGDPGSGDWVKFLDEQINAFPGTSLTPVYALTFVNAARQIKIENDCGSTLSVNVATVGNPVIGALKPVSTSPSVFESNVPGKVLQLTHLQVQLNTPALSILTCSIRAFRKN